MKRGILYFAVLLAIGLSSCVASSETGWLDSDSASTASVPTAISSALSASQPDEPDNIVSHEPDLYCGNTFTTISRQTGTDAEPWSITFWGEDSIALIDLLRYLNYSEEPCKCLPEYQIDTELGSGYSVHLTEGYARYNGRQVTLTTEQVSLIQGIIDKQAEQAGNE